MNKAFAKTKKLYQKVRGFFPESLPTGMEEFNKYIDSLMGTYWMPTVAKDDIIFVVTGTIIRLEPTVISKPKWYFAKVIRAAASKQIAGANFQEVKLRSQAKQQVEATTNSVASNVPAVG